MTSASMRWQEKAQAQARQADWAAVATWVLFFALLVYLGLEGGGYDPIVHDQVGIAVWWIALAGVAIGALPRSRPERPAVIALCLLGAFVAWTALSLSWTESAERTSADLARIAGYLGVFALAIFTRAQGETQRLVGVVAAAIAVVVAVGLLSWFHPAWFPNADQTAIFVSNGHERLSYPLHYWNGLAALIAIGLPLLLHLATSARSPILRGLAAAALPGLMLAIFYTLSRAGLGAAALSVAVFLAFTSDRLPKLLALAFTGAGGGILILAASQRDALQEGLGNAMAAQEGDEMLWLTIGVCAIVGVAYGLASRGLSGRARPRWAHVAPRQLAVAVGVAAVAALIALAAFDAPGRVSNGWEEFKHGGQPADGTGRLSSAAGQNRYQYWSAAARENATDPLTGTGSGTFEFWWARDGNLADTIRDAHSLYMQTLGELGIVGLILLAAFLLSLLGFGGWRVLNVGPAARSPLAAALAGCTAFCFAATFDWLWQIPVLPVAVLLLASALVGGEGRARAGGRTAWPPAGRIAFALLGLAAIAAIAVPLASTTLVRQSEADARAGDLIAALDGARSAQNAQPSAASPRLQQALLLEELGDLDAAATAAQGATERESTNWRTWLVLSRLEARRGQAEAAVDAYREARALNPFSPLFDS
jgi:O-Antigen ligase